MSRPTAVRAVVVLHGHDDDPAATAAIADRLATGGIQALAPTGPRPTGNGAAWFGTDDDGAPDPTEVAAAIGVIDAVLAGLEAEEGITAAEVVLGGFSQGAALALLYALRALPDPAGTPRLAGVFAAAGWLPGVEGIGIDPPAGRAGRLLILHGEDDEVVPLPLGRSVARLMERQGAEVMFVARPVGHAFDPFVPDIRRWLAAMDTGADAPDQR